MDKGSILAIPQSPDYIIEMHFKTMYPNTSQALREIEITETNLKPANGVTPQRKLEIT